MATEWNFTAVSPRKRLLASKLIKRLRAQFGPGGLLHYGQGKWYPGESLPRWALGCYWRKDGVPVWNDDSLIADEIEALRPRREGSPRLSRRSLSTSSMWTRAGVLPALTKTFFTTCGRNGACRPTSIRSSRNLKDEQERDRIARIFQQGLGERRRLRAAAAKRIAGALEDRARGSCAIETLWLIPGDSPMGLRLPLDSLPWVKPVDFPWTHASGSVCRAAAASTAAGSQRTALYRRPAAAARSRNRPRAAAAAPGRAAAGERPRSLRRPGRNNPPRGSCARRCASSRGMAGCMCSCRR